MQMLWKNILITMSEMVMNFTTRDPGTINDVLIYGSNRSRERRQMGLNNLFCVLYMVLHAGRTIDICIPSLESDSLTKSLIHVKQKNGVLVRVMLHSCPDFANVRRLASSGVSVKVVNSTVPLEHEFLIIDVDGSRSVAMLGSLDFEVNRINCSRDTTLLCSDPALVAPLRREFERVWLSVDAAADRLADQSMSPL